MAPDNSIPLVTGKTIIFRLYPDVRQVSSVFPVPTQVTGDLIVYRENFPGPNDEIRLSPINGPIPAAPSSSIQRSNAKPHPQLQAPRIQSEPWQRLAEWQYLRVFETPTSPVPRRTLSKP